MKSSRADGKRKHTESRLLGGPLDEQRGVDDGRVAAAEVERLRQRRVPRVNLTPVVAQQTATGDRVNPCHRASKMWNLPLLPVVDDGGGGGALLDLSPSTEEGVHLVALHPLSVVAVA